MASEFSVYVDTEAQRHRGTQIISIDGVGRVAAHAERRTASIFKSLDSVALDIDAVLLSARLPARRR
jgi:hypothetical protein